ncbi:MAG: DNA repair protein RecO [Ruminococcus sp.]|nr:DNA repair protein RecO [Ruminococcus sp.]
MPLRKEEPVLLTVKGVVLTQKPVGEQDRFIDILTDELGVLEVLVKGAGKISSKSGCATQLFAYSAFCLRKGKRGYMLDSVSPIRIFYELRDSLTAVALASYFSQIIQFSVLPQASNREIQRLFLNCLHFLSEQTYPETMLKCIFELRMAALLGFMPDVVMCRKCGEYLPKQLHFSIEEGSFCCTDCAQEAHGIEMPAAVLQAVRHIVLQELERIFSFRLQEECMTVLSSFAEQFLQYHIDHHFPALDYYRAVQSPMDSI